MNPLLTIRNSERYFGRYVINGYEFACWLATYNQAHGTDIRPSKATAEMFKQFLVYQRLVKKVGYLKANGLESVGRVAI